MPDLLREEHSFGANPGTKDLARHLYTRMTCGRVVIVAANPVAVMAALRKQWLKLSRKVQRESASTLNVTRLFELKESIVQMQTLRFATKATADELADVVILPPDKEVPEIVGCRTVYITCSIRPGQYKSIIKELPNNSLVVICNLA
jgi:hypothetical protein